MYHYNHERPHQGRSCGNRPPREAFPTLPTLPALPQMVDPDRWLQAIHGQAFVRRVGRDGCLDVDHQTYYISRSLAGQQVALFVNAYERVFELFHEPLGHKQLPIKGVMARPMPFEQYLAFITEQARSEARHAQVKRHARSQERQAQIKPEAGSQGQQVQTKPPTPRQLRFWD